MVCRHNFQRLLLQRFLQWFVVKNTHHLLFKHNQLFPISFLEKQSTRGIWKFKRSSKLSHIPGGAPVVRILISLPAPHASHVNNQWERVHCWELLTYGIGHNTAWLHFTFVCVYHPCKRLTVCQAYVPNLGPASPCSAMAPLLKLDIMHLLDMVTCRFYLYMSDYMYFICSKGV